MVLDTSLLNTQQYKVRIKGKVEQSWDITLIILFNAIHSFERNQIFPSIAM